MECLKTLKHMLETNTTQQASYKCTLLFQLGFTVLFDLHTTCGMNCYSLDSGTDSLPFLNWSIF